MLTLNELPSFLLRFTFMGMSGPSLLTQSIDSNDSFNLLHQKSSYFLYCHKVVLQILVVPDKILH